MNNKWFAAVAKVNVSSKNMYIFVEIINTNILLIQSMFLHLGAHTDEREVS